MLEQSKVLGQLKAINPKLSIEVLLEQRCCLRESRLLIKKIYFTQNGTCQHKMRLDKMRLDEIE